MASCPFDVNVVHSIYASLAQLSASNTISWNVFSAFLPLPNDASKCLFALFRNHETGDIGTTAIHKFNLTSQTLLQVIQASWDYQLSNSTFPSWIFSPFLTHQQSNSHSSPKKTACDLEDELNALLGLDDLREQFISKKSISTMIQMAYDASLASQASSSAPPLTPASLDKWASHIIQSTTNTASDPFGFETVAYSDEETITLSELKNWMQDNAPYLLNPIVNILRNAFISRTSQVKLIRFLAGTSHKTGKLEGLWECCSLPMLNFPEIKQVNKNNLIDFKANGFLAKLLTPHFLFQLSWSLEEVFLPPMDLSSSQSSFEHQPHQWYLLYSAYVHGFGLNRFEVQCLKYNAPTLILLHVEPFNKTTSSTSSLEHINRALPPTTVLGVYVDSEWVTSKSTFWGGKKCAVYEFQPNYFRFPSTRNTQRHVFYHGSLGLQFGGESLPGKGNSRTGMNSLLSDAVQISSEDLSYLLYIDTSFQKGCFKHVLYGSSHPAYKLNPNRGTVEYEFNIVDVQVYGFSLSALKQQKKDWEFEEKEAGKRGDVNVHKMGEDMDRVILELAGVHQFADSLGIVRNPHPQEES